PDGKSLVAAGNFPAKVWDVATGQELATLAVTGKGVLSPDRATFARRSPDHTVKLQDAKTGSERATLRGHAALVYALAFSPDSRTLASSSGDQTVKLWDVPTQKLQATLRHSGHVCSVAFSPDGKTLAAGNQF